jgi:hypothetical protein
LNRAFNRFALAIQNRFALAIQNRFALAIQPSLMLETARISGDAWFPIGV